MVCMEVVASFQLVIRHNLPRKSQQIVGMQYVYAFYGMENRSGCGGNIGPSDYLPSSPSRFPFSVSKKK